MNFDMLCKPCLVGLSFGKVMSEGQTFDLARYRQKVHVSISELPEKFVTLTVFIVQQLKQFIYWSEYK